MFGAGVRLDATRYETPSPCAASRTTSGMFLSINQACILPLASVSLANARALRPPSQHATSLTPFRRSSRASSSRLLCGRASFQREKVDAFRTKRSV